MLRQEIEEQLAERLVNRIEETNTFILQKIGNAIKTISTLTPSQAYQISQILKYGGSYEEIAKELARVSGKNVKDIYKIFDEVAKNNKQFAKDFYKYRGIDYIPYNKDLALQQQVRSIATITANTYKNIANTSIIGLIENGEFKQLKQAYQDIIDKAILSVTQGKQDFYSSMRNTLKEIGRNGIVQYESGRTRRLDSAIRMNMLDGIRQLNNETSIRFGKEYNADGVEISVHSNPAPDHADIQGRQFSNEEYEKLEAGDIAKDYKGNIYDGADKRQISTYNCYHKIFSIVLGVSKPEYTDEQLKKIQEDNQKGFEYEGKHYTNYEGTQLQRRIETEIRKQKDTQILAKASGDKDLIEESQKKITQLTHKYNDLCKISGLLPKKQRMTVSGYVRTKVEKIKTYRKFNTIDNIKDDTDYNKMIEINRNNITNEIRNSIYRSDWENNDRILNEYGYINSDKGSTDINKIMRYPHTRKEYNKIELQEYDKTIYNMKEAIKRNTIQEDIMVTRYVSRDWLQDKISPREFIMGNKNIERDFNNIKKIKEINENGFISTSLNYSPYEEVMDKEIKLNLKVDKGTHAFVTENKWESEIIFDKSNIVIEDVNLIDNKIVIDGKIKKYRKI